MKQKSKFLWFLMGLGSEMQIIASLSFTELFSLLAAPFLFMRYHQEMKRDGIMPFFILSICVFIGCVIACQVNHTVFQAALRGYSVTAIIPCSIITSYWLIRRDANGFKWFLLGAALSTVLSTFAFQKAVEITGSAGGTSGAEAVEAIMNGPIYVTGRLRGFITLLTQGWYLHTPILLDIPASLFYALFAILTTVSGRSASLSAFAFVAILLIGGKKMQTMKKRICQRFWLLVILGVIGVFVVKNVYSTAASQGWLGEEALKKYEGQTKGDKSLMGLLLGGRMESFCGVLACVDKPIVGFGPWARDRYGYIDEFITKYGKPEDVEALIRSQMDGNAGGEYLIPCHSYITGFWVGYGIFGLVFWLYVLFVLFRYLKEDCWAVPQWFAWLACAIPGYCWNVFFSPLGNRFTPFIFIVACLMARAVRRGIFQLPMEMQCEMWENEQKRRG